MPIRLFLILVQEEIQVNSFIKVEPWIIFYQLLILGVVLNSIDLEEHDIWGSADPLFGKFLLAWLISLIAFDFGSSAFIPCGVEISFIDLELNWSQLVNVLIGDFLLAISINDFWNLNLATKKILPDRILEFIQIIIHQDRFLVWVHHALLSKVKWIRLATINIGNFSFCTPRNFTSIWVDLSFSIKEAVDVFILCFWLHPTVDTFRLSNTIIELHWSLLILLSVNRVVLLNIVQDMLLLFI